MKKLRYMLGGLFSRWADSLLYGDNAGHTLIIHDAAGCEIFNCTLTGGYSAVGPPEPYVFDCCDNAFQS